ncbi:MAG TPA: dephospho-CoA kinase [Candidatus Polarisedimenticolaceae bacterium]|nr:dephospho-CoA kinase [Candidatus Polarisedimenticolaceae bacterium]
MLRVGLTGGLASGKSTVAAMFRELGATHVDADAIAHQLLAPGGRGVAAVTARFGTVDRGRLGAIVFRDDAARADLNAILHPLIREEIVRATSTLPGTAVALIDAALLVETGMYRGYDALVVVSCRPETQMARAVARGMSEADARARLAAQAPLETKTAVADFVIDTETTLDRTAEQVRAVWEKLKRRA